MGQHVFFPSSSACFARSSLVLQCAHAHTWAAPTLAQECRIFFSLIFCCCSMCLFAFLAGDHWPKLYMHPKFPMEHISTRKAEGNRIAQGHTVAFPWGTNWFAPKWLQPVSLRFRRLQRASANAVECETLLTVCACLQRVGSVLNSESSSHWLVLSMSQGFLAEIRAVFKIRK